MNVQQQQQQQTSRIPQKMFVEATKISPEVRFNHKDRKKIYFYKLILQTVTTECTDDDDALVAQYSSILPDLCKPKGTFVDLLFGWESLQSFIVSGSVHPPTFFPCDLFTREC